MNDLRTLRERAGWTQTELAKKIDVAQSYVSDVESGKRSLSIAAADKASRVFGVSARKLREDTHDAGVVARLGPAADLVERAAKVATKSQSARNALVAELDELIDQVSKRDDLDDPGAVRRVLKAIRQSIDEPANEFDTRDGFGRRVDASPQSAGRDFAGRKRQPRHTERDAYGRKVTR